MYSLIDSPVLDSINIRDFTQIFSLTEILIEYLVNQAKAGAQLLQVFESNCGYLSPHLFEKYCRGRLERIGTF